MTHVYTLVLLPSYCFYGYTLCAISGRVRHTLWMYQISEEMRCVLGGSSATSETSNGRVYSPECELDITCG